MNRIITDELTNRTLERMRMIAKGEEIPQDDEDKTENEKVEETSEEKE